MSQQLYWLETILKSGAGLLLIIAPVTTAKLLGLPHGNVGFWARLLGITLIGLAAAIYIEATQPSGRGLGFAGLVVINIIFILMLMSLLILKQVTTWRGAATLWLMTGVLLLLTLFEIAYA